MLSCTYKIVFFLLHVVSRASYVYVASYTHEQTRLIGGVCKRGLVMLCHVFIVDWLFDYFDCFLYYHSYLLLETDMLFDSA